MKKYISFLQDQETQQSLVDYYTGKINGRLLKAALIYLSHKHKIENEDGFIYFVDNSGITDSYKDSADPCSSGSFLYGVYDVDTEETTDGQLCQAENAYSLILSKL